RRGRSGGCPRCRRWCLWPWRSRRGRSRTPPAYVPGRSRSAAARRHPRWRTRPGRRATSADADGRGGACPDSRPATMKRGCLRAQRCVASMRPGRNTMSTRLAASLLLWLLCACALAAVPERPRFRIVGAAQGLPSTDIKALARDADGYLWIATADGLARHDGVDMRVWRHDPADPGGLPGNNVQALL